MTTAQLFRAGAGALLVGGVLGLLGLLLSPMADDPRQAAASPLFLPANLAALAGALLTVLGLPAAYAAIARRAGPVGLLGFVGVMLTGILLGFFPTMLETMVFPWIATLPIPEAALEEGPAALGNYFLIASLIALAGAALLGLVVARSGVFAPWPGYLLILAGVVNLITGFVELPGLLGNLGGLLFYLALAWLGVELWRRADMPTEAAAPLAPA